MNQTITHAEKEKRTSGWMGKTVLISFLVVTSVVVMMVCFIVITTEDKTPPTSLGQLPVQNNEETAPVVVEEREISGVVVFTNVEDEYIRVAVPGEGMYSIGVDTTKVDLESIEPMSEVKFVAHEDTEEGFYDFIADDVPLNQVSTENKETLEERLERLRTTEF